MCMAALLMGGVTMAQHARRGGKDFDPKVRAEHMTEQMAKKYSLTDEQKAKLLEVNLAFVEKMGDKPGPRPGMQPKDCPKDTCCCKKQGKPRMEKGKRPELTDEQREQMKAGMEQKRAEMEANRAEYNAQLQQIMTPEQYEAYTKDAKERRPQMPPRR